MGRGRIVRWLQLDTIPLLRLDSGEGIPNWNQVASNSRRLLSLYLITYFTPISLFHFMRP
jgi:hypothetical protein